jgi:DNA-binding XRE family transcriptional regulator
MTMTEWKYPGDDAIRKAFAANLLRLIQEKGLTVEEFERGVAESDKEIDKGLHRRAFGRTVKRLREERRTSRSELAVAAGISLRLLIQIERGHGPATVQQICRIAYGLRLRLHELVQHYWNAVKQIDSSQAW